MFGGGGGGGDIYLTNDCYSIVFLWCTVCFVICIWL